MKRRIAAFALCVLLLLGSLPVAVFAAEGEKSEEIVILYENDVHCAVEGYSKLSAMKKELQQTHAHVGVVSSGDFIQGTSLGVLSRGEYIINLMNLVGYDAVALGNHEFDFRLDRLNELVAKMSTKPVCCNFQRIGEENSYFSPYTVVNYGDVQIAYIGITTPETISVSSTGQFKDEEGEWIYTFHANDLFSVVQTQIDAARSGGADYVIALSHLGDQEPSHTVQELIAATEGLDVVLDAHSHSVIEQRILQDKGGDAVILTSTGTKFEHIGKLTISQSGITASLVETAAYEKTDPAVDAYLAEMYEDYEAKGNRKVCVSEVDLIFYDESGNRLVRRRETNLGDLCADAYRTVTGADIGYMNGGGLRAPIYAGVVTYNTLLNVLPYNNQPVAIEATGQAILDMLELVMRSWPAEEGSFPHLSGLTFSLDISIPATVELDEHEMFVGVTGEYRVYNVRVQNRESGAYEPLDLQKTYIIAGPNHNLLEGGGGMSMFAGAKVVQNSGALDVEALETYITEHLGGVIGQKYAKVSPNITFTNGKLTEQDTGFKWPPWGWWVVCGGGVVAGLALAVKLIIGKRKQDPPKDEPPKDESPKDNSPQ